MALTALKLKSLEDNGFPALFTAHEELWRRKAAEAFSFTRSSVVPTGQAVRPDDVLPLLESTLELVPAFYRHLETKRLTQQYWKTRFAEYILDRLFEELQQEADDDGSGAD